MNLSRLDLKIELSPSQLLRADEWLNNFYSKCKSRMSDPIVENGFLKISSADIYNFLMAIKVNDGNEFDWSRLKKHTTLALQEMRDSKRNFLLRNYYRGSLQLLESLRMNP